MKRGDIGYRKGKREDISAIYKIECLASNLWKESYFSDEFNNTFSCTAVALCDEKVVGFAVAWNVIEDIQLNNIGIHPDFRRQGIATGLIDFLVNEHNELTPERIIIEVKSSNKGGIAFYRSLGFIFTGKRQKYYGNEDALLMEKNLITK